MTEHRSRPSTGVVQGTPLRAGLLPSHPNLRAQGRPQPESQDQVSKGHPPEGPGWPRSDKRPVPAHVCWAHVMCRGTALGALPHHQSPRQPILNLQTAEVRRVRCVQGPKVARLASGGTAAGTRVCLLLKPFLLSPGVGVGGAHPCLSCTDLGVASYSPQAKRPAGRCYK